MLEYLANQYIEDLPSLGFEEEFEHICQEVPYFSDLMCESLFDFNQHSVDNYDFLVADVRKTIDDFEFKQSGHICRRFNEPVPTSLEGADRVFQ